MVKKNTDFRVINENKLDDQFIQKPKKKRPRYRLKTNHIMKHTGMLWME